MIFEKPGMEADVIVVGYGAAGAAAAISAHDNGASVIILEKMSIPGGNSRVSAGNMSIPKNPEKFAQYLKGVSFNTVEDEIVDTFVEGLMKNPNWIKRLGGELYQFFFPPASYSKLCPDTTYPGIPGAEEAEISVWAVKQTDIAPEPTGGARTWGLMAREIECKGIKVMTSTPARELIKNQKREVVGVVAECEGKNVSVKARKGVILTCGGFENNDDLKLDYLEPKPLTFLGNPGNTGDGIRMVQKAGAALWHMRRQACSSGFKAPEYEATFPMNFLAPGFIYVDKYGRRFADETNIETHEFWVPTSYFDTVRLEYPRVPFYAIFDEEIKRVGPVSFALCGHSIVIKEYKWSPDNSAEITKGWIVKAKKISELAKRLSIDESNLANTIAKYNDYCKAGKDDDFDRPKEALKAIEGPPYYAIQLWPSLLNTQGGPRRDKEARVLDPDGKPIPRLYAAGEFGSIWGFLYQTSTNYSECLVYGRIAGKNAAISSPVDS